MYLLVGGSGFIGTNFAKFLIENDYDFKIYDKNKSKFLPKCVNIVVGDIRDKKRLSKAMKGCDVVFHLATMPPSVRLSQYEIHDIDVNGTQNVLETAQENKVKKVIFTSSASHVYGLVEKRLCPIREECPLHPINEYGESKVLAEVLCKQTSETTSLQTIILRLSMSLGPYNFDPILVENLVSLFKNKRIVLPGDGTSKNQSIHVKDVSMVLLACAELSDILLSNQGIFNISGKEVLTMDEWIALVKHLSGSSSKVMHLPLFMAKGMVRMAWWLRRTNVHPSYLSLIAQDQYFDIGKAKHVLGWEPKYTVTEALEETIAFLKERHIWLK